MLLYFLKDQAIYKYNGERIPIVAAATNLHKLYIGK